MSKPYAESCDQNREAILAVLRDAFAGVRRVLEIGSGTGQHAVYFPRHLDLDCWQTSDLAANHAGIRAWLDEAGLDNVYPPLDLDVNQPDWGVVDADAVFTANTCHIMDWESVCRLFLGVGRLLPDGGLFAVYGPFNYAGAYSSDSNARFDQWLKERDPLSGIRDFEDLDQLAEQAGMHLHRDYPMPANNRTLVWRRTR